MTDCNSSVPVSLVVLAAGCGSRFGGNKQLALIGDSGKPLMYFSVMDAYGAGIRHLVLVINQHIEAAICEQFLPLLPVDLEVSLQWQKPDDLPAGCVANPRAKPWGTGHALWSARALVPSSCIVINADDYYGPGAMNQLLKHFATLDTWAMLSYQLAGTLSEFGVVNRGLCQEKDGFLVAVKECHSIEKTGGVINGRVAGNSRRLAAETPVSMNIWGFGPDIFHHLEKGLLVFFAGLEDQESAEFYLPAQVMAAISAGENRVRVYPSADPWKGITYREDLEILGRRRWE